MGDTGSATRASRKARARRSRSGASAGAGGGGAGEEVAVETAVGGTIVTVGVGEPLPTVGEGVAVAGAVGGTAVAVDVGVLLAPPQAAASTSNNTREARVSFTSLMLLSRPTRGH